MKHRNTLSAAILPFPLCRLISELPLRNQGNHHITCPPVSWLDDGDDDDDDDGDDDDAITSHTLPSADLNTFAKHIFFFIAKYHLLLSFPSSSTVPNPTHVHTCKKNKVAKNMVEATIFFM